MRDQPRCDQVLSTAVCVPLVRSRGTPVRSENIFLPNGPWCSGSVPRVRCGDVADLPASGRAGFDEALQRAAGSHVLDAAARLGRRLGDPGSSLRIIFVSPAREDERRAGPPAGTPPACLVPAVRQAPARLGRPGGRPRPRIRWLMPSVSVRQGRTSLAARLSDHVVKQLVMNRPCGPGGGGQARGQARRGAR
jgi:hypothetical protein